MLRLRAQPEKSQPKPVISVRDPWPVRPRLRAGQALPVRPGLPGRVMPLLVCDPLAAFQQ
ncbi:hypothetical protein GGTG_13303 [Gaeumannomyces tritici R3-111a-1]|uniref:Uncharacterized protein n=1 Tax=Gaeumannomyces tritici (strain R3-111a-1) TaxID=644352 RepID=J3PIH5_GAET3|nr:hypothetical protein GGTG_13303 [Gaeumannomyces tritici R3-111a-1]EJT69194.1 hypothetical protein GGTG_13303 [Gaeumannomyces tritici R3-111a-1]